MQSSVSAGFRIYWAADHRDGVCVKCEIPMEIQEIDLNGKKVNRPVCPECGGMEGRLVSRGVSIQPPNPPSCLSLRCLIKYFKDSLFCTLLLNYHERRIIYAEANKGKKILERYRTGEPSPNTIWQAIHANIKLKCPVCRKFNVDPFLGGI